MYKEKAYTWKEKGEDVKKAEKLFLNWGWNSLSLKWSSFETGEVWFIDKWADFLHVYKPNPFTFNLFI